MKFWAFKTHADLMYCRVGSTALSLSTGLKRGRQGVSRGEVSTRILGGFLSISRAWSCQNEARLGEDEVPDNPNVLRTRYSVKILALGGQLIRRNSKVNMRRYISLHPALSRRNNYIIVFSFVFKQSTRSLNVKRICDQ